MLLPEQVQPSPPRQQPLQQPPGGTAPTAASPAVRQHPASRAASPGKAGSVQQLRSAPSSPEVGARGGKGRRYSPESQRYAERLQHQGAVISSLYLRRQLSGSQERHQGGAGGSASQCASPAVGTSAAGLAAAGAGVTAAHAAGLRDSASFHTVHATPPRPRLAQRQQQQQQGTPLSRLSPPPAAAAEAAASLEGPIASPSPLSKFRPAGAGAVTGPPAPSPELGGSLRFETPNASIAGLDPSAAEQQQGTPGATPLMTPLTAISRLRGMAAQHGPEWEGQQQQMHSILSRLESRVRWGTFCVLCRAASVGAHNFELAGCPGAACCREARRAVST